MLFDPNIFCPLPFIIWRYIGPKFLADDGHVNDLIVRDMLVPVFLFIEVLLWYIVNMPVELTYEKLLEKLS